MELSNRVNAMGHSPIRRFNKYAIEAEANGKKVYHLNIGQPDVETPACFMEAVKDFDKKVVAYSNPAVKPCCRMRFAAISSGMTSTMTAVRSW